MVENQNLQLDGASRNLGRDEAQALVARALSKLGGVDPVRRPMPALNGLCEAFIDVNEERRHQAIDALLSHGMAKADIIDRVLPALANEMGVRWASNSLSFAEVSIGTARLQETVRTLSKRAKNRDVGDGDRILIVAPRGESHTLGFFIATQQFRRLGIEVEVGAGMFPRDLAFAIRKQRYPMVGISVSSRRTLSSARELVKTVKEHAVRPTPVVIGGAVVSLGLDVKAATGCDFVCADPKEVIRLCDLKPSAKGLVS